MIRVLMVHEHRLVGDIITAALRDEAEITVIGYAASVDAALDFVEGWQCDVVVASITLADNGALRIARTIVSHSYPAKVLITDLINSKTAILHCIEEGAAGYVYEDEPLNNLVEKIQLLHKNEFPVPPPIAAGLIARINELKRLANTKTMQHPSTRRSQCEELTAREREVLSLMAEGCSNQEIAELLVIEVGTVKNHVHNIFRKLDIQNRDHAIFFAQQLAEPQLA